MPSLGPQGFSELVLVGGWGGEDRKPLGRRRIQLLRVIHDLP